MRIRAWHQSFLGHTRFGEDLRRAARSLVTHATQKLEILFLDRREIHLRQLIAFSSDRPVPRKLGENLFEVLVAKFRAPAGDHLIDRVAQLVIGH